MKRILFILALVVCTLQVQASGIEFFHGTWAEGVAKAKAENKKIFVDFFTEWCGPCLNMALTVFPQPEVGEVYNKNFVCMKIDAEKGEGVDLARKYGVRSYPSYIFVDPATEEMIHRSGGNKPMKDFINDTKGALDPKLSSIYLQKKYQSGDYDAAFLRDYIRGAKYSGSRNTAGDFAKLLEIGGPLTDRENWDVFVECVRGFDNPYIKEISDNYSQFCTLFGREAVDAKLRDALSYAPEDVTAGMCDFEGKDYLIKIARMSNLFRGDDQTKAWDYVDQLLADPTVDQKDLVDRLRFYTRVEPTYRDNKLTFDQLLRKVGYTRYVAYNTYDRDEALPHYYYAVALEYLMQRAAQEGRQIPESFFAAPKYGKTEYSMRHPLLKPKPRH